MKIIHGSQTFKNKKFPLAIALGNFDGVHRGHQAILREMITLAHKKKWKTAVYTFEPHPTKVLAPKTAPLLIQTLEQKMTVIENLGIDFAIVEKFDQKFSKLTPTQFFSEILLKRLAAKGIWTGYDFTFGCKRSGSAETLKEFCKENGLLFKAMEPQFEKETLVSSTQIRGLITKGNVEGAQTLLGRPFALIGQVIKGHGIGNRLGIHTANLEAENELLPKTGIYVTRTEIGQKKSWASVTSVGYNPTFPGKGFSVETHLIDFKGDLRGKKIEVYFLKWLRDEFTFPNEETLVTQIKKDIAEAKRFHETFRNHR